MSLCQFLIFVLYVNQGTFSNYPLAKAAPDKTTEVQNGGKMIGGKPALPHSHPYAAYFRRGDEFIATGVIVDPYTILTFGYDDSWQGIYHLAYAGKHSASQDSFESTQQTREVCFKKSHRFYKPLNFWNSYTIVALREPLRFNNYVQAIPLAPKGFKPKGNCTFASWQLIGSKAAEDVLYEIELKILPDDQCPAPHETKICASSAGEMTDNGGPLVCQDGARKVLYGIFAGRNIQTAENSYFASMPNYPMDFMTEAFNELLENCPQTDEE